MKRYFSEIFWLLPGLILFCLLLALPLPPVTESRGIYFTDIALVASGIGIIYIAFQQQHWGWKSLALAVTMWLFTLATLRLWESADSTWNVVLGLLPWSDASGYYADANSLRWGIPFSAFSGRRPMFAGFLSVLLKLTSQNLQHTLLVVTALNGFVAFLFSTRVKDKFGAISGISTILFLLLFYTFFAGTTLTEQLGIPLGLIALAILINSVEQNKTWAFALGLLFLTFALLARAGPFFVLLTLMLFGLWRVRGQRIWLIKSVFTYSCAIVIPFTANAWLGKTIATPDAVQMSNFSYTLYGQAVGGKGWQQPTKDYPALLTLNEKERTEKVYQLALAEIRKNPGNLLLGSIRAWKDFIYPSGVSIFSFIPFSNRVLDLFSKWLVTILFLFGLVVIWGRRREPVYTFLLTAAIGVFLSIPALPPIDAQIRPYTATIGFIFLANSVAISYIFERWLKLPDKFSVWIPRSDGVFLQIGFLILTIALAGPIFVRYSTKPVDAKPIQCNLNEIPITFKITPGSFLVFENNDYGQKTHIPTVLLKDVERSLSDFFYVSFARAIRDIDRPVILTNTIDISSGKGYWIIAPHELANMQEKIFSACATPVENTYSVIYINSLK